MKSPCPTSLKETELSHSEGKGGAWWRSPSTVAKPIHCIGFTSNSKEITPRKEKKELTAYRRTKLPNADGKGAVKSAGCDRNAFRGYNT
uniref:Uncharacterized protein n=1 Tax=Panagrellus redivivus TaxID=6233 RepID=A0A7E4UX93_PANRE